MKRLHVFTVIAILLSTIAYGGSDQVLEKVTLKIEGMTESCCAPIIEDALLNTNGVKKASVRFEDAEALVEFEADKVTTEQLIEVVKKLGYRASVKETGKKYEMPSKVSRKVPEGQQNTRNTGVDYLPLAVGLLGSLMLIGACLKMKAIKGYKTMLRIIKQAFVTKLCLIVGVALGIIYAVIYLLLGHKIAYAANGWIVNMTVSDLLITLVMAFLIAVVMALFTYTTKKCGISKSKKSGVGLLGILFALLVSFSACCGPIIISLIGVGTSMILAQYSSALTSASIMILVGGIMLITRTIEKEEECVCCEHGENLK